MTNRKMCIRDRVSGVYHTMRTEKQLFIQAPTGIGKTMAAIFPAVRAVGEGYGDKIFYLTAKTITRTVAEEAFHILKEKGLSYKTISITAKEKLCLCEETDCNPEKCPYAEGHFDRVNVAVFEILNAKDTYLREDLLDQAEKHRVCPYEMCLDISSWVDAVICDYNYVFCLLYTSIFVLQKDWMKSYFLLPFIQIFSAQTIVR